MIRKVFESKVQMANGKCDKTYCWLTVVGLTMNMP